MRKLLYGVYLLFVAFIWGCTQDSIEESIYRDDAPKIYAYTDVDNGSRVELNSNTKTVWTAGDQILVMGDSQLEAWQFTGKTGDRYGEFTRVRTYDNWGDAFGGKAFFHGGIEPFIRIPLVPRKRIADTLRLLSVTEEAYVISANHNS
jgi:hypothetical protein